jgi:hypothetical protein
MAKGIRLPARAKAGRLELLGGDEYIEQLIRTGLGEPDSENPWNVNGLGEFMIYDINDSRSPSWPRARARCASCKTPRASASCGSNTRTLKTAPGGSLKCRPRVEVSNPWRPK